MPLGEEESKVSRLEVLRTNSETNLRIDVVTSGVSAQASRQKNIVVKCVG